MPYRDVPPVQRGRARSLRSDMTDAERRIWARLRAHRFRGASFRRQMPIDPYVVDFVCFKRRLVIEIDGGQHASREVDRDARRDAWLRSQGFTVLRFWNNDVLRNISGVTEVIAAALPQSVPTSLALPRRKSRLPDLRKQMRNPGEPGFRGGGNYTEHMVREE